jgi:hypothetical protein
MAAVMLFAVVVAAHFIVSVVGQVLALRVAFDTAPGGTARPLEVVVVRAAEILLAPLLVIRWVMPSVSVDYPEIAATSVAFGAAAVAALWLAQRWRRPRQPVQR